MILERLPLIFGLVLGVTFIVLLLAFGSVVVAGTAIVLSLLSVAAAYGLLVLVFQNQWAEDLLGFRSNGAVVSWLRCSCSSCCSGCRWTTTCSW